MNQSEIGILNPNYQGDKAAIRELYEVTSSPTATFPQRIQALLELGCRRFGLSAGVLARRHEDTMIVEYAFPPDGFLKPGVAILLCQSYCNHAIKSPKAIMIEHASASEWRTDPGYTSSGLESYLGTKVFVGEEIYGTFCFLGQEPHGISFTETDEEFLMLMARWVEGELKRHQAEEALRINEQSIRDLYHIISTRGMTFDQRVEALLKFGCQRYQLPIGCVTRVQDNNLIVESAYGTEEDVPTGALAPLSDTLCQLTVEAHQPVAIEWVDDLQHHIRPFAKSNNFRTYIGAPLRMGKYLFGTLCFVSRKNVKHPYSPGDSEFLQLMAQWLSHELDRQQDEASIKKINLALSKGMPGISRLNTNGQFTEVNGAYAKILGYEPKELIGESWERTVYPTDMSIPVAAYQTMLEEGQAEFEARAVRKDGSVFIKQVLLVKEFDLHGNHSGHYCFMRDITEQKHLGDALRALAETNATLTGTEFLQFIVKTLATCLDVQYAFITECVGPSKHTLRTLAFWDGTTFGENFEYDLANTPCQDVIEGEVCFYPQNVQQQFPDDGDLKTLKVESYVGYPLISISGDMMGHVVAMDTKTISETSGAISIIKLFASRAAAELERNRAELASRRSEGRLRQVIDLVPQLIFAKDNEGRFILCNETIANLYGTTVQALIGKSDMDFPVSQKETEKFHKDDLEVIRSGKVKIIKEEQLTDISGEVHYLHTTKIPFVFADTTRPAVLGVSTDITEQKMVESQLRESYERTRELTARLEAAEESERKRIARELHDEFGQMLAGLKFDTAWLNRHLAKEKGVASLQPYLQKLKNMGTLLDKTIQSVRRIATSLRPTILDDLGLIPALEWQAEEFHRRTGVYCHMTTAPDMTNTILEGERATALFRIVQELLTNVMRHAEASEVNLDLYQEDNFVILTVQDNGRGISEREIGHGTSLGLLGIKERLSPFGGIFHIRGTTGNGTRATVLLPFGTGCEV